MWRAASVRDNPWDVPGNVDAAFSNQSSRASSLPLELYFKLKFALLGVSLLTKGPVYSLKISAQYQIRARIRINNPDHITPQKTALFCHDSCHTTERDARCRLSPGADPGGNRHGCRLSCTGPWMARCSDRWIRVRTKESAAGGPNRSLGLCPLWPHQSGSP